MTPFLTQNNENNRWEFLIDGSIFSDVIALKAAYAFLDRAYFFFKKSGENTLVQITPKEGEEWDAQKFAGEYADELLATHLRERLEKENKTIRETIVKRALASYLDENNFTSIDAAKTQEDYMGHKEKDIDEVLQDIENDPDFQIDEAEVKRIMAEIEKTNKKISPQPLFILDPQKVQHAKEKLHTRS